MVRRSGMGDIRVFRAGHVTGGAIIVPAPREAVRGRQTTSALGVAFEAATAVICRLLFGRRQLVGIVAGDTPQSSLAADVALTFVHLFNLPNKPAFVLASGLHEHRPEPLER